MDKFHAFMMRYTLGVGRLLQAYCKWAEGQAKNQLDLLLLGLGPIFARHVTDLPVHEAKVAAFWRNAILLERGYDGSPMRAHLQAGDVKAGHFPDWLALFDATLQRELPADTAASWSALAHRIGQGLRMGVADVETRAGVPVLR